MPSTVLIVDDNEANCLTLESILEEDGYILETASDGPSGLARIMELLPDVVLLDVMMPGMDGFEVCRKVRSSPDLMEIPIVLVTALDDNDSMLRGLEAGADDFLHKPFNRSELRAKVQSITRLNRYRNLVIERARLSEALKTIEVAYDATLRGWMRALDLRDKETEGHSERVTEMAVDIAKSLDVQGVELENVRRGALLHDIGKLGVPDAILHKAGPLTESEWVIMRMHPTFAMNMLEPIEYLRPVLVIPYCHHEKWDGSGYPRGLKGNQIPLSARIFSLVDVWDALTNDRPYRAALSREEALGYILEQMGQHFDPRLTVVFWEYITRNDEDVCGKSREMGLFRSKLDSLNSS